MLKRGRGRPRKIDSHTNLINIHEGGLSNGAVSSEDFPEFFTIYSPAICSDKMEIPSAFIKNFGVEVPKTVTLKNPFGQSWQVNTNKINEHYFFQKGWPEFVQENSVKNDDFLTFCYAGNSIFDVKIFATNGCRKSDIRTGNLQENVAAEPEKPKSNQSYGRNSSTERSRGRKKSVCRDTSFTVLMGKCYMRGWHMNIPTKFYNVYLKKSECESRIVTLRTNNKSWPVSLGYAVDRVQFVKGWSQFLKDNSLRKGNLCTFDLIDRKNLVFNVTISR